MEDQNQLLTGTALAVVATWKQLMEDNSVSLSLSNTVFQVNKSFFKKIMIKVVHLYTIRTYFYNYDSR